MATLDIFNDDAFSVTQLTQTIIDIPRVPTRLGDSGMFNEYGINTLTMAIERTGSALNLVPTAPRGGVREPIKGVGRKLIPIMATHLPQSGSVLADEVQGVRVFGSETEVEAVSALVKKKIAIMKGNLDLTLEHMRVGAVMGKVLDADGVTPIWDLYDIFGFTQVVKDFQLDVPTTNLKAKVQDLKRSMARALGGRSFGGVRVMASQSWFDAFTEHADMKARWDKWQDGTYARTDQSDADFDFLKAVFSIYEGGTSAGDFVPDGTAFAYPVGVPNMFQTAYAPGDYMETVNTNGLPYYTKQEPMPMGKGVALESQSNPIMLNTLPEAVFKLTI